MKRPIYLILIFIFFSSPGFAQQFISPEEFKKLPEFKGYGLSQNDFDNIIKNLGNSQLNRSFSGGWTGGGGGGVECPHQIVSLDYWENINQLSQGFFLRNLEPLPYLEELINYSIEPFSALLAYRLRQALAMISKNWISVPSLAPIEDYGKITPALPKNKCNYVQYITRIEKHQPGKLPKAFIVANQPALEKLQNQENFITAKLNLAMIYLHEAIYLLAIDLGHADSSKTRVLTALLMSMDFQTLLRKAALYEMDYIGIISILGGTGFGSLFVTVYEDEKDFVLNQSITENEKERIKAYSAYMKKIMTLATSNVKSPQNPSKEDMKKARKAVVNYFLNEATNLQVYLAVSKRAASWYSRPLDSIDLNNRALTADTAVVPGHAVKYDQIICEFTRNRLLEYESQGYSSEIPDEDMHKVFTKAHSYCKSNNYFY